MMKGVWLWLNRSELTHVEHQLSFWRINLDVYTTSSLYSLNTAHLGQAGKKVEMVNESMSLQELTARAYARGLPATKVRSNYLKSSG